MKTIIRIQHPNDGRGLFTSCYPGSEYNTIFRSFSFVKELITKHEDFPTPYNDDLYIEDDDFCAFKSISQLNQWIEKEWWSEILDEGFEVLMMEVSEWQEGKYQILFKKEHILSCKDISVIFRN